MRCRPYTQFLGRAGCAAVILRWPAGIDCEIDAPRHAGTVPNAEFPGYEFVKVYPRKMETECG